MPPIKNNILGDIFSQIHAPNNTAIVTVPNKARELPINTPYISYIAAIVITAIWLLSPKSLKHNINIMTIINPAFISLLESLLLVLITLISLELDFVFNMEWYDTLFLFIRYLNFNY